MIVIAYVIVSIDKQKKKKKNLNVKIIGVTFWSPNFKDEYLK